MKEISDDESDEDLDDEDDILALANASQKAKAQKKPGLSAFQMLGVDDSDQSGVSNESHCFLFRETLPIIKRVYL